MTNERREILISAGVPITGMCACGCIFRGSERDEEQCLEGHVHGVDYHNRHEALLRELAEAARDTEDARDFVLYVQERLKAYL